jgi:hypothetical protein
MSRTSRNTFTDGYNYDVQAWYRDGRWVACNHPLTSVKGNSGAVQDFDALLAEAHAFVIWLREDRRLRDLARARRDDVPNLALCISCDVTYPLGVRHRC